MEMLFDHRERKNFDIKRNIHYNQLDFVKLNITQKIGYRLNSLFSTEINIGKDFI